MDLLKPVKLTERIPTKHKKHYIKLFSGELLARYWNPHRKQFGSKFASCAPLVDYWYLEFKMPTAEDMQHVVASRIPEHVPFEQRELMLRGVRMGMEALSDVIKSK